MPQYNAVDDKFCVSKFTQTKKNLKIGLNKKRSLSKRLKAPNNEHLERVTQNTSVRTSFVIIRFNQTQNNFSQAKT